jgi:DNA repair exonuclease SbcCD ATPase subunit
VADEGAGGAGKTYTQEEVEAQIAEATKALEAKRDELLNELKPLKSKMRELDGVDAKRYREMEARLAELEQQKNADKAGLTSEALAKLRADVEADVLKRLAADADAGLKAIPWAADLARENRALKLDSVVKAEMAKGGARAERIDALFRLTQDRYDLTDDGKPVLKDKPALELSKYVADELRKEYPEFYNGSGSSGGGASKSNAGGGGSPKTIAADDGTAFIANLEQIAKGEVQVTQ